MAGKYSELAKANAARRHQAKVKGKKSKPQPSSLPKPPGSVSPFTSARCLDYIRDSIQQRKDSQQKPKTTSTLDPKKIKAKLKNAINNAQNKVN